VPPGGAVALAPGEHRLRVSAGEGVAVFAYRVSEPPAPGREGFYSERQTIEARGFR
jgi:hypothetical protein